LGGLWGIEKALEIISPIDGWLKKILILAAKAKLNLFHKKLVTVGVTGSWGKTTMKEKLDVVLGTKFRTYKTFGNNNTLVGVAINVLKMPLDREIFVCEMGAFKIGDIRDICELVKPKVGIITAIGPMHLERFGSLEVIERTKREIHHLIPADGLKIDPGEDVVSKIIKYFDLDPALVSEALLNFTGAKNRLEVSISNGITIIDDSYNSNPAGFEMALSKLKETVGSPKILVTPGMVEMGHLQHEHNKKIAQLSKQIADVVVFVGETNREAWEEGLSQKGRMSEKQKSSNNLHFVKDMDEAKNILTVVAKPGAVVLFENDLPDQYF
jgi:UDP-N-acetylmuramoyl-tripeptide--D-alanyl-D-alanine ligase